MPERTIAFRIDEDLHKQIKMRLIETNKTLKDYVIDLIKADLEHKSDSTAEAIKTKTVSEDAETFFNDLFDYILEKQAEREKGKKKE